MFMRVIPPSSAGMASEGANHRGGNKRIVSADAISSRVRPYVPISKIGGVHPGLHSRRSLGMPVMKIGSTITYGVLSRLNPRVVETRGDRSPPETHMYVRNKLSQASDEGTARM